MGKAKHHPYYDATYKGLSLEIEKKFFAVYKGDKRVGSGEAKSIQDSKKKAIAFAEAYEQ